MRGRRFLGSEEDTLIVDVLRGIRVPEQASAIRDEERSGHAVVAAMM